jgi:hypothetical protein
MDTNEGNPLIGLFRETASRLRDAGIPFWLEYGALLGLIRDGSLISWDQDIDLGLWRHDVTDEAIIDAFAGGPLTVRKHPESDCFHIRPKDRGIRSFIDLNLYTKRSGAAILVLPFSKLNPGQRLTVLLCDSLAGREHYPHGNPLINRVQRSLHLFLKNLVAPMLPNELRQRITLYPARIRNRSKVYAVYEFPARLFEDLAEIELFGLRVSIPGNTVEYLERAYGRDWRIPRKWKHWSEGAAYVTDRDPNPGDIRHRPEPGPR